MNPINSWDTVLSCHSWVVLVIYMSKILSNETPMLWKDRICYQIGIHRINSLLTQYQMSQFFSVSFVQMTVENIFTIMNYPLPQVLWLKVFLGPIMLLFILAFNSGKLELLQLLEAWCCNFIVEMSRKSSSFLINCPFKMLKAIIWIYWMLKNPIRRQRFFAKKHHRRRNCYSEEYMI